MLDSSYLLDSLYQLGLQQHNEDDELLSLVTTVISNFEIRIIFENANGVVKYINSELHDLKYSKNQTKYLFRRSSGRPERGIFLSCDIPRKEIRVVRAFFAKSKSTDEGGLQKFIKNKVLWFPDGQLVKNKILLETLSGDKKAELSGILTEFRNNNRKIVKDVIENVMKINPDDGTALLTVMIREGSGSKETKHIGDIEEYRDFFKKGILLKKHKILYDATCLICNNKKLVQTFVERPLPYYYTDNYLYFPDGQQLFSRKGFSLCDDCYLQLQKGIRFIKDNLNYSISQLGSVRSELNFWLIPHLHDQGILLEFKDELENNKDLYLNGLRKLCLTLQTISDIDESDTKNIDSFLRFSSLFYTVERYYMRVIQYTQGIYPTQLQRLIRIKEETDKKYPYKELSVVFKNLGRQSIQIGFPLIIFFYKQDKNKVGRNEKNKKGSSNTEWQRESIHLFSKIFTGQDVPPNNLMNKINAKLRQELFPSPNLISFAHTTFLGLILIEYLISLNANPSNEKMSETDSNNLLQETNVATEQIIRIKKFIKNHDNILSNGTNRAIFAVGVCVGILLSVQEKRYDKTAPFWNRLNRLDLNLQRIIEFLPEIKTKLAMYNVRQYDTMINYLSMEEASKIGMPSSKPLTSFIFSIGLSYGYMVAREYI